jgi:hypothetical protein
MHSTFGRWTRVGLVALALLGRTPLAWSDGPRAITISAKRFAFSPGEIHLRKGTATRVL